MKYQDWLFMEYNGNEDDVVEHYGDPEVRKMYEEYEKEAVYRKHGYRSRLHYLKTIAEDFGIDLEAVIDISYMLGPGEDFDGLVSSLEEYCIMMGR